MSLRNYLPRVHKLTDDLLIDPAFLQGSSCMFSSSFSLRSAVSKSDNSGPEREKKYIYIDMWACTVFNNYFTKSIFMACCWFYHRLSHIVFIFESIDWHVRFWFLIWNKIKAHYLQMSFSYNLLSHIRPVASRRAGVALAPPVLAQPGWQIMSTTVLWAPPDFQSLRRPCTWL